MIAPAEAGDGPRQVVTAAVLVMGVWGRWRARRRPRARHSGHGRPISLSLDQPDGAQGARFVLLPGQRHDNVGVEPLLDGVAIGALIGDKGFDADSMRQQLDERGVLAVIPPKAGRKIGRIRHAYRPLQPAASVRNDPRTGRFPR